MCDDKWYCRWNRGGDRKNSIIRWLSLRMSLAAACSISILEILPLLQFYSWSETISTCTSSCRQGAVFIVADRVASSVFFAAADIWAHKKCRSWGWDKIYGGFTDILSFVEHPVIHSPAYRANSMKSFMNYAHARLTLILTPMGACLLLNKGMCQQIISEWSGLVKASWPQQLQIS